jgi:DUF3102 family protein
MLSKPHRMTIQRPREPLAGRALAGLNQPPRNPGSLGASDTQGRDLTARSSNEDGADACEPRLAPAGATEGVPPGTTEPFTPSKPDAYSYAGLDPAVASAAQAAADRIRSLLRPQVASAIDIGRDVLTVKSLLAHGKFTEWLRAEFEWSERTAQRYMRLTEEFGAISDILSEVQLTVLHRLAATSTTPEVRKEVVARLRCGERLKSSQVIKLLRPESPQVQQQGNNSTPGAASPEACEPQPDASSATMASVAQGSVSSVEAAQEAARIIIARLGPDLDRLAELLQRADPHHLLEMILSHAQKQPEAGCALDQPHAEGGHDAQPEVSPVGNEESVSPDEAASEAPATEDANVAQSAADPSSAGRTATMAALPSGDVRASANMVDSPDLTVPAFLRRPPPPHLCIQPAGGSNGQSDANLLAGEGTSTSTPGPALRRRCQFGRATLLARPVGGQTSPPPAEQRLGGRKKGCRKGPHRGDADADEIKARAAGAKPPPASANPSRRNAVRNPAGRVRLDQPRLLAGEPSGQPNWRLPCRSSS